MSKSIKSTLLFALLILIGAAIGSYQFIFNTSNLDCATETCICEVRFTTEAESIFRLNDVKISNATTWNIASRMKSIRQVKPGRYRLTSGMTNNEIIREIRSGGEATLILRIDDVESTEELAGKLGNHLLNDSAHFMQAFSSDSILSKVGINASQLATIIRPNTYEFYWNMSAESFLRRMKSENDKLWTPRRIESCNSLNMTPTDVITLASIVKAETASPEEAPRIAGLYMNRLKTGIPLQSDPTTLFGRRKAAQRVYLSDLQSDSPYNTYKIKGLPPGPINFPETVYIDAVLNAESHAYFYMCAEPGGTGRHRFSANLSEHEKNRREYVSWLNSKGIQ
jgi:UPF0755 protein